MTNEQVAHIMALVGDFAAAMCDYSHDCAGVQELVIMDEARAAVEAALRSMPAEPVAWRYKELVNNEWISDWVVIKYEPPGGVNIMDVQPLYATPHTEAVPQGEPDIADIIAGALPTSRAHAYELMRQALKDATPPTAPVLTEAEIRHWWKSENGLEDMDMCDIDDFREVVRAVEERIAIVRAAAALAGDREQS